jgi:hypothetical protein
VVMGAGDGGRAKLNRQPDSCTWAFLIVPAASASPLARVNKKCILPLAEKGPAGLSVDGASRRTHAKVAAPRNIVYDRRESNQAKQCASLYLPLDTVNLYLALSGLLGEIPFQWCSILQTICDSLVLHYKQYSYCLFLAYRKQPRSME